MLPEDIRNMDFGQASMPHAPEAQTPEVPYDTTISAPDRPAIPLSPDMLSGNLRENDSEKSGIEFSFDAFGYTQQVELVQESYADGNLAVTAYLSDPTDESFGQPWSSVTVNFGSPLQQDATVFLDTNNMGEAMLSKISQLGAFTGQFMRSGFCSYPAFTFDTEVMGNMRDLNEFASADHSSLLWLPSSVPVERIHPSSETIPPRTATTGVTRRTHLNGMSIAATTMPSATHSAPKSRCSRPVSLRRAISSTWSRRTGIIAIQTAISASSGAATARKTFSGTLPATRTVL